MELLVMAAGMGSRFGGLKQIEPMGPNGEFLIDYSVYDAIKAGFSKVIFIIKEENYEIFKDTIGKRVENHISVDYVFQKLENVPDYVKIPENRVKPWGTAHAVYCAKDKISEDFVIINADDFYGRDAFMTAGNFLKNSKDTKYSIVGYKAKNTMTNNGSVKRGIIISDNGNLKTITESSLEYIDGKINATPLDQEKSFIIDDDSLVSMNMLTFDKKIFNYLEQEMNTFFKDNEKMLEKCEFLIPNVLQKCVQDGIKVKVLNTNATWYGVTYREDSDNVKESLKKLVLNGEYPNQLWD